MRFIDYFRQQLAHRASMPFAEFMQHALYSPTEGYYTTGKHIFGAQGDFVTAPELTPLFGYTLANQCAQILQELPQPIILEFGAGTGQLCIDLLTGLKQLQQLPESYTIIELSASLQAIQRERIQAAHPDYAHRINWLSTWPTDACAGILLANEVLDAMPVQRFLYTNAGVQESMVSLSADDVWVEHFETSQNTRLIKHVQHVLSPTNTPYLSEANLFIEGWLQQCFSCLTRGALLLIDYGFPQHEYYHADRHQGTLMCHSKHKTHANLFAHPSEEDLTAHVDFTHVAEAAVSAGFHVAGFTNQASFLLSNNLLSWLHELTDEKTRLQASSAVKTLIQPHEMGELFKVIALTKQLDLPLVGFKLNDQRTRL